MTSLSFRENVTIITGASSGIGEALAYELAGRGAWLVLGARNLDALETVAEKCRTVGGKALAVQADVSEQEQCHKLVERAVSEFGRVDTLVNNAGISMWARFETLENPDLIERVMKVNFLGAVYCTYYALPYLKQTQGRIGCISSLASKLIAPGNTGYVASKLAMEGFFDSLRPEIAEAGVSVTMLGLGFIDTGFAGRMLDAKGEPSEGIARMLRGTKQVKPEDAARWIAEATWARKRQAMMPVRGLPGALLPWLRLIAPGVLERIGSSMMKKSQI